MTNETDKVGAYNITRNSLLQAVSWTSTTIPEYNEARNLCG
jgi:hypothetical protein